MEGQREREGAPLNRFLISYWWHSQDMAARMCNVPQTDRQDNIKMKAMLIMNNVHREPSWVELWPCLFYARTRLPSLSALPPSLTTQWKIIKSIRQTTSGMWQRGRRRNSVSYCNCGLTLAGILGALWLACCDALNLMFAQGQPWIVLAISRVGFTAIRYTHSHIGPVNLGVITHAQHR